ncbi:hypothetical protein BZA05DRAFT_23623 [Tricharina praecox]|uniref:uncharacterized protein n=1 Tax=Tricharina praecox TaxID=43433 RepID=UPI002220E7E8|nr:uncharacterized protein BZA05DRAFT_23623 [Tricharina praecox]KAI5859192.1 hypothetical protein BZA05DRAFT_23623 [Tricharina praecox]
MIIVSHSVCFFSSSLFLYSLVGGRSTYCFPSFLLFCVAYHPASVCFVLLYSSVLSSFFYFLFLSATATTYFNTGRAGWGCFGVAWGYQLPVFIWMGWDRMGRMGWDGWMDRTVWRKRGNGFLFYFLTGLGMGYGIWEEIWMGWTGWMGWDGLDGWMEAGSGLYN